MSERSLSKFRHPVSFLRVRAQSCDDLSGEGTSSEQLLVHFLNFMKLNSNQYLAAVPKYSLKAIVLFDLIDGVLRL